VSAMRQIKALLGKRSLAAKGGFGECSRKEGGGGKKRTRVGESGNLNYLSQRKSNRSKGYCSSMGGSRRYSAQGGGSVGVGKERKWGKSD